MSVLGTVGSIVDIGTNLLDKGYDIYNAERGYSSQSANNAWNQRYSLITSLWNRQNQLQDQQTLFNREDTSWQRAVADIQKAGLSTTMLSGGAGSGMVSGHGASSAPSLGSGKFQSGATVGSVMDLYGQYLEFKQKQEQTKLIKDQQSYYQALKDKVNNDKNNDNIKIADQSAKTKAEIESMNANTAGRLITNQSEAIDLQNKNIPTDKKSLIYAGAQNIIQTFDYSNTRKAVDSLGLDWRKYRFNPAYYFRHYRQVEQYARDHYN